MCGHDGHMACLVGFVPLVLKRLEQIPSDRTIKLLFQPSEEGPGSGAKKMVEDGCLDDVDEVYGFHQLGLSHYGELSVIPGPMLAEKTDLSIWIYGTGGHGGFPELTKFSTAAGVRFYQKALGYFEELKKEHKEKFACSLPLFQAGEKNNVISETCFIAGTLRCIVEGLTEQVIGKLRELLEELATEGFTYKFEHPMIYPMVINHPKETEHVRRVGRKFFGEQKVTEKHLPLPGSEDFSYFLQHRPGAYFFLTSSEDQTIKMAHDCNYNFYDGLIPLASEFWL